MAGRVNELSDAMLTSTTSEAFLDSNTTKIVLFTLGEATDHRGRLISDVWGMSDETLESTHDYIQWLFPIPEGNSYNDFAPLLNDEAANWFHRNSELQAQQKISLDRMVGFFGLKATGSGFDAASHLNERDHLWLRQFDHNHRRISRIIRSVYLCHQPELARSFCDAMIQIGQRQGDVSDASVRFWKTAIS